jgi:hypothetical protein
MISTSYFAPEQKELPQAREKQLQHHTSLNRTHDIIRVNNLIENSFLRLSAQIKLGKLKNEKQKIERNAKILLR